MKRRLVKVYNDSEIWRELTLGQQYEVYDECSNSYKLLNDNNKFEWYCKARFIRR